MAVKKYTEQQLLDIFQNKYDQETWYDFLCNMFRATGMRREPQPVETPSDREQGYFYGKTDLEGYCIGFFYYRVHQNSVAHRRVGLRQLVRSFINANYGLFDAAIVVFESDTDWRLSFISDIKGQATAPKRYTFVFGDRTKIYRTPISRFIALQNKDLSYSTIKEAFSVEALTKQFYNELFDWYQWAVAPESRITFPNNVNIPEDDREDIDIKVIRLITRVMFVWFI